jgi:uncharacterized lipoprotein YmbA
MLLGACASAPMHYYTLIAPAVGDAARPVAETVPFELLPVSVPAQDDQPQLVIRQGGQGVALLQNERWIAPLADEVRGALSADLTQALGSADVTGLPHGETPVVRVKVDVRRFDSQPGSYARLDAGWSLRLLGQNGGASLSCSSRFDEAVGPGYDALVQGHQQALGKLAATVAATARQLVAGKASCPAG